MVWILIWLQLTTSQSMSYYHVDTFDTKEECVSELSKASVLVTNKNTALDCIPIQTNRKVDITINDN